LPSSTLTLVVFLKAILARLVEHRGSSLASAVCGVESPFPGGDLEIWRAFCYAVFQNQPFVARMKILSITLDSTLPHRTEDK